MSKVFIHCGAHKTGSSLLQRGLERHRDDLLERGVVYVKRADASHLALLLNDPKVSRRDKLSTVSSVVGGVRASYPEKSVLISHETIFSSAFCMNRPLEKRFYADFEKNLEIVLDAVGSSEAHLLMCIRRQDTFLESSYLEGFQVGYYRCSFSEFLERIGLSSVSWWHLAETMTRHLPRDRISVMPFEIIRNGSREYLRSFLTWVCDPEGMALERIEGERRSLSGFGYRVARLLDKTMPVGTATGRGLRYTLIACLQRAMSNRFFNRAQFWSPQERQAVLNCHAEGNARLFASFLPDWPARFYCRLDDRSTETDVAQGASAAEVRQTAV